MSKHKVTNEIRARIADKTGLPVDVLGKEAVFQLFSDQGNDFGGRSSVGIL